VATDLHIPPAGGTPHEGGLAHARRDVRGARAARSVARAVAHNPARFAFCLALLAGLAIAIFTPPLRGADERDQFTRAYQISSGTVATVHRGNYYGALVPSGYQQDMHDLTIATYVARNQTSFLRSLGEPPPTGHTVFAEDGTFASYGPGAYVVYAASIAVGRAIGLGIVELIYLARFAGVLTYALLFSLAVRRLPLHRWVLVACGLIPEALNQASTVSADGVTMVLSFLVVAEALALALDPGARTRRVLIEVAVASVLLALAKPPYMLFVLLLVIPAWRYRHRLLLPLGAVCAASGVLAGLWLSYEDGHSMRQDLPGFSGNPGLFQGTTGRLQQGTHLIHVVRLLCDLGTDNDLFFCHHDLGIVGLHILFLPATHNSAFRIGEIRLEGRWIPRGVLGLPTSERTFDSFPLGPGLLFLFLLPFDLPGFGFQVVETLPDAFLSFFLPGQFRRKTLPVFLRPLVLFPVRLLRFRKPGGDLLPKSRKGSGSDPVRHRP